MVEHSAGERLEVEDLSKEFPTPSGPLSILRDVRLSLAPGAALAIVGPSGSGKSTLLHILGALEPPTRGRVLLGGVDPHTLRESDQAAFRARKIGFVFQDHHLLPQLSVLENVLVPALAREKSEREALTARARSLLDRVGLTDRVDHRPAEISGGERQRVALARALLGRPALVLADEPTGNLDRSSAKGVGELLLDLQRETQSILLVVTHSAELAALLPRRMELRGVRLEPVA